MTVSYPVLPTSLAGKVAIVTGASSGVGRDIALSLARAGANVIVADLSEDVRQGSITDGNDGPTARRIIEEGFIGRFVRANIASEPDVAALFEGIIAREGRVDIVVNNAGIVRQGYAFQDYPAEMLDAVLDVNLKGTWYCMRAAIQHYLARGGGGNIINIISTAGLRPHPMQSVYNLSKMAIASMTQCAALEHGRNAIRINGLCPMLMATSATTMFTEDKGFLESLPDRIPLGRLCSTTDVANAALFLASDASSYIHGVLLPVDGGEMLMGPWPVVWDDIIG